MEIIFKSLNLANFKSHADLTVEFGDTTQISGENAVGKSSIPEAVTWLLYGMDTMGSKLDPIPTTYESYSTKVSLLLDVEDEILLLGRELKKGKATYYINEVPSKATEFNDLIAGMFDKDLFMSLFNPSYFPSLHWEKQRALILQYVTPPANKEVFKALPEAQGNKLAELVKKHSLEDLNKIHRANKNKLDKEYIAAQSRTKTLKEQLEDFEHLVPLPSLRTELKQFTKKRDEAEKVIEESWENNSKINTLQNKIKQLMEQRDLMKDSWPELKNEPIEEHCRTCKQTLQDEAIEAVQADKDKRINNFKSEFDRIVAERNELEKELENLQYIDVSEQQKIARENQEKINPIEHEINKHSQFEVVQEQIAEAEKTEKETLESLNNSIFILDSIKDFNAKEAELQVEKVQALFENLSIKLFNTVKSTGEMKPTFEIKMDGKEYSKLSLSEKIRAGLEVRDVLSEQSNMIVPCFVDNAESITKFKEPNGQLIMCKVVAGKELEIKSND